MKRKVYIYTLELETPEGKVFHSGCFSTREKAVAFAAMQKELNGNDLRTIYRDLLQ